MKLSCIIVSALLLATAQAHPQMFEDVDDSNLAQDLLRRANSVTDTTTSSTTSVPPTGTNSAGFPTGTSTNNSPCTGSAQCQSGNCYHSQCKDPQPAGSYGCYKDQGCATGRCVNSKCVPKDGTGAQGAACNMSGQCMSGSFCNHSACDTQKDVGSSCYKNVGCTTGNCVNGSCINDNSVAKGGSCTRSVQCINSSNNFCSRKKCAQKQNTGGPCYKDVGCYSGFCRRAGTCA